MTMTQGGKGMPSSFHIYAETVSAVLLADGWHEVAGASFSVVSYKFVANRVVFGDGTVGFRFTTEEGTVVAGPLTSILAMKQVGQH